jgi:hypothetical protein
MGLQVNTIGGDAPVHRTRHPRGFGMLACPHCGDILLAPDVSEYMGDGRVRHTWSCDACGHEFQASIEIAPR